MRVVRGMPIWSDRLGLTGRADVVEFHGETPYPVEYKSGQSADLGARAVQVCAQAICLEEMLGVAVPAGAVWYHGSRQRREIGFDAAYARVAEAMLAVRAMLAGTRCRRPRTTALPEVLAVRRVPAGAGRAAGADARFRGSCSTRRRDDEQRCRKDAMQQLLNTLYVPTPRAYLHLDHDTIRVEVQREMRLQAPLLQLSAIVCFGDVMISPALLHRCAEDGRWCSCWTQRAVQGAGGRAGERQRAAAAGAASGAQ